MESTSPFAFGSNESAAPVTASSRAMRLRVCPPMFRELAAHQNLSVRLHRDRIDITVRVRVESRVERAVRVQSGNVVARHAQDAAKDAGDEDLAVRLDSDGVYTGCRRC